MNGKKISLVFSNISATKHFSEMVQYPKHPNEIDLTPVDSVIVEKSGENHGVMVFFSCGATLYTASSVRVFVSLSQIFFV